MSKGDVSDLHQQGVPLDDLTKTARLSEAVVPRSAAAQFEAGLLFLAELRSATEKAQNAADGVKLIAAALADEARMMALGVAYGHRPDTVTAHLVAMRQVRGLGRAVADLERAVRRHAKAAIRAGEEREERYEAILLDKVLTSLGASGVRAPAGWTVSADEGVASPDGEQVCAHPMVILGASRDVDTGLDRLLLAWHTASGWVQQNVPRSTAMNHRKLVDLTDQGAPVTSVTAQLAVKYLAAFEAENAFEIHPSSGHLGWVGDGQPKTFLHGEEALGEPLRLAADTDERQYVRRFVKAGTWEGWLDTVRRDAVHRPSVMAGIYASCASVLIRLLDRESFIVDWSGESSVGKTTALRFAASVWGEPTKAGVIRMWNAAGLSGLMRSAWLNQSIPLFLDDTKEAESDIVKKLMYVHSSGSGRIRAKTTGSLRATDSWASVLMSTGEAPMTSFSKDQGARARVICMAGSPYGAKSKENKKSAERSTIELTENYGHLGPRFVSWLLERKDRVPALMRRCQAIAGELDGEGDGVMTGRLLGHIALIQLAAELLHAHIGLPGHHGEAIAMLVGSVRRDEPRSDLPQLAADELYAWASANEASFWKRTGRTTQPDVGWYGRWDADVVNPDATVTSWSKIGFQPSMVMKKLREWGYDSEAVVEAWRERGWRKLDRNGQNPNYGLGAGRLLVLTRDAFSGV